MDYICYHQTNQCKQQWTGHLDICHISGEFFEVEITGRGSSFHAIVGSHSYGNFICIPNHEVGSELAPLSDVFWNLERLSTQMNDIDAATVAYALGQLADFWKCQPGVLMHGIPVDINLG